MESSKVETDPASPPDKQASYMRRRLGRLGVRIRMHLCARLMDCSRNLLPSAFNDWPLRGHTRGEARSATPRFENQFERLVTAARIAEVERSITRDLAPGSRLSFSCVLVHGAASH
jgi:hypothetical protein